MNDIIKENLEIPFEKSYHGILRSALGNTKLILPGVRLVAMNADNHFLFTKRADNGNWVLPGGSVEYNESVLQSAIREFYEETGLIAINLYPIALYTSPKYDFTNAHGGLHQMFTVVFLVKEWKGQIRQVTSETINCRFFSKNKLPKTSIAYSETVQDALNFDGSIILK